MRTVVLFFILAFLPSGALTQEYVWAPDFPVGSTIPLLDAPDQNGNRMTLSDLSSRKGLLLAFNRSFDWCPYCKAQLIDLNEVAGEFEALGITVVTITYDPVETLKQIEQDQGIVFPMLHDEDVRHVNSFGIRNMNYSPGEFGYGIPEPGILLIDPEGVIRYKFAEENYRERPDLEHLIEAAGKM